MKIRFNFHKNIPKRRLMLTQLVQNTLKLLPFKWLWRCSNVVGTSSDVLGKVQNSSENGRKSSEVTGTFSEIPVMTRLKAHAFDSEKVGGYTFNLECYWVKGTLLLVNVAELTVAWLIE